MTEDGGTISEDGRVEFEFADCAGPPSCTDDPSFVREGDIVEINQAGIGDLESFYAAHGTAEATARLNALLERHDITSFEWEDIDDRLGPYISSEFQEDILELDLKGALFERLVRLQTFEQTVRHFDTIHSFREKGVVITLFDDLLNGPLKCPNPAEGARAICDELEAAIADAEDRMVESLRTQFDLWAHVSYWGEPGTHRPRIENFDGALIRADYAGQAPVAEELRTIPENVRDWLTHLSTFDLDGIVLVGDSPVDLNWGPGVICEADFCPSDFGAAYRLNEALLEVFIAEVPDLAAGFGVPMFEGAHFDIRNPVSNRSGSELNRVGETGYNNPTLNIYASQ